MACGPEELLAATIKDICAVLKQEHEENKKKPAEVGRKSSVSWLLWCGYDGARFPRHDDDVGRLDVWGASMPLSHFRTPCDQPLFSVSTACFFIPERR